MMTLRLCLCAFGIAFAAANSSIDQALFDRAIEFAKNSDQPSYQALVPDLEGGDAQALYLAASGLNSTGASFDSIRIWHALADGPERHAPSAYALGVAYDGTGRDGTKDALRYFVQASKEGDCPESRQPALLRAGKILTQFGYLVKALEHYRKCVQVAQKRPEIADAETTKTCTDAHGAVSRNIAKGTVPGGLLGYVEVFEMGSLDGFPAPSTKERKAWDRAVKNMKEYSDRLREGNKKESIAFFHDAHENLSAAIYELEVIKRAAGGGRGMSELQEHMADSMLTLMRTLDNSHKGEWHDEL